METKIVAKPVHSEKFYDWSDFGEKMNISGNKEEEKWLVTEKYQPRCWPKLFL